MKMVNEKCYEINNLISISGKYTATEFQKALMDMVNLYKDYSIDNGEYLITTTKSIEMVNDEQVMDVEILMPVSYRIPVKDPYVFKNRIKLTNALYEKVTDITKLQDTLIMVDQYMLDQKMQAITSAYLVQTKENNQPCVEIYIGINPNIL